MRRHTLTWAAILGAPIAYDVYRDRRHDESTLSCVVRHTFHTHHPIGRAVFIGAWAALTAWICPHICRVVRDANA